MPSVLFGKHTSLKHKSFREKNQIKFLCHSPEFPLYKSCSHKNVPNNFNFIVLLWVTDKDEFLWVNKLDEQYKSSQPSSYELEPWFKKAFSVPVNWNSSMHIFSGCYVCRKLNPCTIKLQHNSWLTWSHSIPFRWELQLCFVFLQRYNMLAIKVT